MTDQEIYDLCKKTSVILNKETGNLEVSNTIAKELIDALRSNKSEIVDALSGHCFASDVYFCDHLRKWEIVKTSNIMDVYYNPITVYAGTARDVDFWAYAHRKDPLFSDLYTSKYIYCAAD